MEMPIDILTSHLANEPSGLTDHQLAMNIDLELQRKFVFFPDAELSEIAEGIDGFRNRLVLGQGPGYLNVDIDISVEDAYTLAQNALAIWWFKKRTAELDAEQEARLAKRPAPGVYLTNNGAATFAVIVTEDQRVMVPQRNLFEIADQSGLYDENPDVWMLQRIDITDGSISA